MSKPIKFDDLPAHLARFAEAQIATGRFASIEDVVEVGLEALKDRDAIEQDWIKEARGAVERNRAAHVTGTTIETTPDELMDGIARELGLAD